MPISYIWQYILWKVNSWRSHRSHKKMQCVLKNKSLTPQNQPYFRISLHLFLAFFSPSSLFLYIATLSLTINNALTPKYNQTLLILQQFPSHNILLISKTFWSPLLLLRTSYQLHNISISFNRTIFSFHTVSQNIHRNSFVSLFRLITMPKMIDASST